MRTLKLITLTLIACICAGNLFAQTINPRQYAVLKNEQIAIEGAKRKDGTYSSPGLSYQTNLLFTNFGEYLYILNPDEKDEGKFIVYDVAKKSVVKTFKLPKSGLYSSTRFTFNQNNMYQVAVMINKSQIMVLPDWRTEAEDALMKKKPESSTRITVEGKIEGSKFAFSKDGKSLYLMEYKVAPFKVIDLSTGTVTKKTLPKDKSLFTSFANLYDASTPFIGNDEALIISQKNKKDDYDKLVEIYDIPTGQVTRSYPINMYLPVNYNYNPKFLYAQHNGEMLNLLNGEMDLNGKELSEAFKKSNSNNSTTIWHIANKGFVVNRLYYKREETKSIISTESSTGLFFFNKNLSRERGDFSSVNANIPNTHITYFQVSPNGRYIVFKHEDPNESANNKWIIATL